MKSVFRAKHDKDYVVVNKSCVLNPAISLKAKGLHLWMMSFPDDWEFNIEHMIKNLKESKNTIYAILNELKSFGYIERRTEKDPDTKRITKQVTIVHETPKKPHTNNCDVEPHTKKPHTKKPDTAFSPLLSNKEELKNKKKLNNKPAAAVDSSFSRVSKMYEGEIGLLTATIGDELGYMLEDYPEEYIVDAIKIAAERNSRNLRYVKGILRNWQAKGRQEITKPKGPSKKPPQVIVLPDPDDIWLS